MCNLPGRWWVFGHVFLWQQLLAHPNSSAYVVKLALALLHYSFLLTQPSSADRLRRLMKCTSYCNFVHSQTSSPPPPSLSVGTGKTVLARAAAAAAAARLFVINGPDVVSEYYGESEAGLRGVFAAAKALAPSVSVYMRDAVKYNTMRMQRYRSFGRVLWAHLPCVHGQTHTSNGLLWIWVAHATSNMV